MQNGRTGGFGCFRPGVIARSSNRLETHRGWWADSLRLGPRPLANVELWIGVGSRVAYWLCDWPPTISHGLQTRVTRGGQASTYFHTLRDARPEKKRGETTRVVLLSKRARARARAKTYATVAFRWSTTIRRVPVIDEDPSSNLRENVVRVSNGLRET